MGMLDGLLGGIVGAGMVSVVNNIIDKHGGLQGVVQWSEKNGLGATVRSWVGTGPNQAISADEVHRALGPDLLQQLSQKSGLSVPELAQKLAQVLPQAVDKMTPDGSPVAYCGRWTRSGSFSPTMASSPPTTGPREPCGVASCGGSGPWGRRAPRATAGWSASCRSAKRAAYGPSLPTPCW